MLNYIKINNTLIHLNSIRSISKSNLYRELYIKYKASSNETEVIKFSSLRSLDETFMKLYKLLGAEDVTKL